MPDAKFDVLVVGGGTGGCAAAMAACDLGLKVAMTEPTRWLGGQLTSQAVPPDEHPWIETTGCTARYREYRDRVRAWYRTHRGLTREAKRNRRLNPGGGWVSRLCHEPRVGVQVLDDMLAPHLASGLLTVMLRAEPVSAEVLGDRVAAVRVRTPQGTLNIEADWFIDASETGDLLPLTGAEYVLGAESHRETGEPHALAEADPNDQQGITWCFVMAWDPAGDHTIAKPAQYDRWRAFKPEFWPGPLLGWTTAHPVTLEERVWTVFDQPSGPGLFSYRQIVDPGVLAVPEPAATVVNWPQNDYFVAPIVDVPEPDRTVRLEEARQLSLSLLYWLQTEAERPDGGAGFPGLRLCPEHTGTDDGFAMAPYIRESRRIKACFTVTELHVASALHPGADRAPSFADSVGVGCYRIDLHPSTSGRNSVDIGSLPFEIPLGALIPVRLTNLIAGAKNLGTTHISNGCFRLHPVEWNIGEAAGALAAFCTATGRQPRQVLEDGLATKDFQSLLDQQGVQRSWPSLGPV